MASAIDPVVMEFLTTRCAGISKKIHGGDIENFLVGQSRLLQGGGPHQPCPVVDDGGHALEAPIVPVASLVWDRRVLGAVEVDDGDDFFRGAPDIGWSHRAGNGSDCRKDVRMLACEGVAHEPAVGHAAGVGAIGAEVVLGLQVLDEGHEEAVVVGVAVAEVRVPVVDAEVVFSALGEHGHKAFRQREFVPIAVGPDQDGTARVAVQHDHEGSASRDGIRGIEVVGAGEAIVFKLKLGLGGQGHQAQENEQQGGPGHFRRTEGFSVRQGRPHECSTGSRSDSRHRLPPRRCRGGTGRCSVRRRCRHRPVGWPA